jgi:hypothetical protein
MQGAGQLGDLVERVCPGQESSDDRPRRTQRSDARRALQIDPTDSHQGAARAVRRASSRGKPPQTHNWIGALLGLSVEDRPKGDVVGLLLQGDRELLAVVGGYPHAQPGGQPSHIAQAQVRLPDMHAVAVSQHGQVRSVVGEQPDPRRAAKRTNPAEQLQCLSSRCVLGAELDQLGSGAEDTPRELDRRNAPRPQSIDIDDWI